MSSQEFSVTANRPHPGQFWMRRLNDRKDTEIEHPRIIACYDKEGFMAVLRYRLVLYSGVAAFASLLATVLVAALQINFTLHRYLGFTTSGVATLHAVLVVYTRWRRRH